jgi:RsiW-degrading membrane proteinase PrsW (M82 family)
VENVYAVLAAVGFAVFLTCAGLMATVALAPHGEERMFPLNVATVVITLVGHPIFGLVLGLAYLKAPRGRDKSDWPWPPLSESALVKRAIRFSKKVTSSP